jgi:exodeoxyribonuclease VII large subunit
MGRGGGSIEDLWAFNEECVAHAIFHSKIPIIAAIGHETDHTIADYVADVRAPTPSAAAEIVIAEKAQQEKALELFHRRLGQTVFHLIKQNRHRLEGIIRHPLFTSPYTLLGNQIQKMDDMRLSLNQSIRQQLLRMRLAIEAKGKQTEALKPTAQIRHFRQKLIQTDRSLQNLMAQFIALRKERMGHLIQGLQVIDPKNLLSKGYSILFSEKDNSVIVSTHQMAPNDTISVMVSDGKAKATVKEVYNNEQ